MEQFIIMMVAFTKVTLKTILQMDLVLKLIQENIRVMLILENFLMEKGMAKGFIFIQMVKLK